MFDIMLRDLTTGIHIIIMSFYKLKKHPSILAFAAIAPLISFFLSPVLFHLTTRISIHGMPEWIFTFLFSFLGLIIFNYVYLGLVLYNFRLDGYTPYPLDTNIWRVVIQKSAYIIGWSAVSAAISTLLTISSHFMHQGLILPIILKIIDACWWLINFLIIPVIADGAHTFIQSIKWTIQTIINKFIMLVGCGGTFYAIKHIANQCIYAIVIATPRVLIQSQLISIVPQTDAYTLLILVSIIGIILTSLLSIISFSIQATAASSLYLRIIGQYVAQEENPSILRIIVLALIAGIIFCLVASALSTALMIAAWRIPAVGKLLISIFT